MFTYFECLKNFHRKMRLFVIFKRCVIVEKTDVLNLYFFQKSVLLYGKSHWPSTQVGCTRYDAFPLSTNLLAQVLLENKKTKYKGQKLRHFRYSWLENELYLLKKCTYMVMREQTYFTMTTGGLLTLSPPPMYEAF